MNNKKVVISPPERRELSRRVRSRTIGAEDARRAQVILALGSGLGVRAVAGMLRCSFSYVQRWRERFLTSRLAGLVARHQGRRCALMPQSLRRAFWSGPVVALRTEPPTGAAAGWPSNLPQ